MSDAQTTATTAPAAAQEGAAGEVLLRLGQAFLLWVTSSGSTGAL